VLLRPHRKCSNLMVEFSCEKEMKTFSINFVLKICKSNSFSLAAFEIDHFQF
jgi:hypothetical protein